MLRGKEEKRNRDRDRRIDRDERERTREMDRRWKEGEERWRGEGGTGDERARDLSSNRSISSWGS